MRRVSGALALACAVLAVLASSAGADPSEYGIEDLSASLSTLQAGAHPDLTTTIKFKQDPAGEEFAGEKPLFAQAKNVYVETPPGLLGNPNALTACSAARFADPDGVCPYSSQVGLTVVDTRGFGREIHEPVYLLESPAAGGVVARLGFWAVAYPIFFNVELRSDGDYGLTVAAESIPGLAEVIRVRTTIWGVPADASHDTQRITSWEGAQGAKSSPPRSAGVTALPFLTNPTSCGRELQLSVVTDSYSIPGVFVRADTSLGTIVGCDSLSFSPTFTATPTSRRAASPAGLESILTNPQNETPNTLANSAMREARVVLPEGMTIAAGAAEGLEACSAQQAGYRSKQTPQCPAASKLGIAEIDVAALERPIHGALYQRTPEPGNLFRVWLTVDELGLHLALPGELEVDHESGQISATFADVPEAPVRLVRLSVFGGSRGPLATPSACGTYRTHFELYPHSGKPPVSGEAPMVIDQGCDTGGFAPKLSAGATNPSAGGFTEFLADITRESGERNIAGASATLPPGVTAKVAGVALCEGIAVTTGDCPEASRIGSVAAASGPGATPLWVPQADKEPTAVYLAGPYLSAPYSFVVKVPAQAGPFDLGDVVTRVAAHIDPQTARVTAVSDPLPQMLEGVPLSYRHIHLEVDRPEFTVNPTSCEPMAVEGVFTSDTGQQASADSRFQVGGCRGLGFKPRLSLRLKGGTGRGDHPALSAILTPRPGDANIASVSVAFPKSEFLENAHIRTVCTRADFAASNCPQGAIYGKARAITPLLDFPLEANIYLRSSDNLLPDVVPDFRGPPEHPIKFESAGRVDSVNGGIRNTFDFIPDVPITRVLVRLQGGKKGLLVNSRDICAHTYRATVKFTAHNGMRHTIRPKMVALACKKAKKRKRKAKRGAHKRSKRMAVSQSAARAR
jgi:hypothetical protein